MSDSDPKRFIEKKGANVMCRYLTSQYDLSCKYCEKEIAASAQFCPFCGVAMRILNPRYRHQGNRNAYNTTEVYLGETQCPECQVTVGEDHNYCHGCGRKISWLCPTCQRPCPTCGQRPVGRVVRTKKAYGPAKPQPHSRGPLRSRNR